MSRLQIFPPVVTLYPNDRQLFTARAVPPPPMWATVTDNGDIKSDFSLEVDAAGSTTSSLGAHLLFSGLGLVELTVDDQSRPTSSNQLQITGFINDVSLFQYKYSVRISSTLIEIRNEADIIIFTQIYSTVSGDVYRLELAAGFRLYRNGVLLHSRVNLPTQVIYPQTYAFGITEPTAANPTRIPPPRLIGDWRLATYPIWTAPSHGSISLTGPSLTTEYSGGTTPGVYTLAAAIEATFDLSAVQRAIATITIPPLIVFGNVTELTLQPGQKVRLKTNYDAAQNPLIVWSVVSGGGSFSLNEFTAPTAPGVSIVRATASVNSQIADITITVPAVITPAPSAAAPDDVVEFATNLTDPIWTAGDGLINSAGLWRVPQGTDRKVKITATSGGLVATRDVLIIPKFPFSDLFLPINRDRNLTALISMSEDRTSRITREKAPPFDSYEVRLTARTLADSDAVDAFFDAQGYGKLFILEDLNRGVRKVGWFDSAIRHEGRDECDNDLSFRFLEARL